MFPFLNNLMHASIALQLVQPSYKPSSSVPTSSTPTSSTPTSLKPTSSTPSTSKPTAPFTRDATQKQPTTRTPPASVPVQLLAKSCEVIAVGNSTTRKCFSQNGNMFDVNSKNANITVMSLVINVQNGTSAEVWTKSGSFIGSHNSSVGWTKVGGKVHVTADI